MWWHSSIHLIKTSGEFNHFHFRFPCRWTESYFLDVKMFFSTKENVKLHKGSSLIFVYFCCQKARGNFQLPMLSGLRNIVTHELNITCLYYYITIIPVSTLSRRVTHYCVVDYLNLLHICSTKKTLLYMIYVHIN